MAESILVTQSLHGAVSFYRNANVEWRERAYESLKKTIGRVYDKVLPAPAQRGIDFENTVYNMVRSNLAIEKIKGSEFFKTFVKACKGGEFQKKTKAFIEIDGVNYCLYGKIDILFPVKIIDIKTTGKWTRYSEQNYYNNIQHHLYCYTEKIKDFEYMIAIFNDKEKRIIDIKYVPYEAMTWEEEEEYLIKEIRALRDFLAHDPELNDLWHNTYSMY